MPFPTSSRDFLAWAQTLPSTGAAGRAYREPVFEDSRALSKADARQLELQDAREAITKVVPTQLQLTCSASRHSLAATWCTAGGAAEGR